MNYNWDWGVFFKSTGVGSETQRPFASVIVGGMVILPVVALVLGLPVALFTLKKAALEKAMVGIHQVGGSKTVTVAKAMAVAQPQGALVHYASEHQKMATIGNEQSLIIDPGSRTFDWLVARGMRLVQKQSYSFLYINTVLVINCEYQWPCCHQRAASVLVFFPAINMNKLKFLQ